MQFVDIATLVALLAVLGTVFTVRFQDFASNLREWLQGVTTSFARAVLHLFGLGVRYRFRGRRLESPWGAAVAELLARRYHVEPVRIGDLPIPIWFAWTFREPHDRGTRDLDPEDLKLDLEPASQDASVPTGGIRRWFVQQALWTRSKQHGEDANMPLFHSEKPQYAMTAVDPGGPSMRVRVGYYVDNFIDSHGLEREIYESVATAKEDDLSTGRDRSGDPDEGATRTRATRALARSRLRLRVDTESHDGGSKDLLSGRGRTSLLGVSTVLFVKRRATPRAPAEFHALLVKRSSAVGTSPASYHVAPAFMHEAAHRQLEEETSIRLGIYRELLEELYGEDDAPTFASTDSLLCDPRIQRLEQAERVGRARFALTGLACDLVTRRFEICTALVVRDAEFACDLKLNWEGRSVEWLPVAHMESRLRKMAEQDTIARVGLASALLAHDWFETVYLPESGRSERVAPRS